VIDVPRHSGSLGTVYEDRVGDLAAQAGVDDGELLGRAMAHEIGHMLIGTSSHARFGLMRAVWASGELRRDMPLDWMFSSKEGSELRRRLTARTAAPTVPESVVASALCLE
jgi:hypothetical protein